MPLTSDDLLARLRQLGVPYELHEHPPVLTVDAMMSVCGEIRGAHTKNLFLRDGKKTYFLVTLRHDAQVDLKRFRSVLGARGGLSFASPEALLERLGVESGAVSPLAALNAGPQTVEIFIQDLLLHERVINVHPLASTRTLGIAPGDLLTALRADRHVPKSFALSDDEEAEALTS